MTPHDHTLFTTVPYTSDIPFPDHDDLDFSLSDVFATGMLEHAPHWDLDLDMAGKPAGEFPVPTDFGFNYPVDLVELGWEGESNTRTQPNNSSNSIKHAPPLNLLPSHPASPVHDHAHTHNTNRNTNHSERRPSPPHHHHHHNNNSAIYPPSSPTTPPDTISSDTESISFGPRTPPSHSYTPTYTFNTDYHNSPNLKKRKGLHHHHHTYTYNYPEPSGDDGEEFSLGVLPEDPVFYPSTTTSTGSGHHQNPKRRRSAVDARSPSPPSQPSPYQESQPQPQPEAEAEHDIFTPLEMPDGSTRFTSNWLPVDPSGGFTICPDPLAAGGWGEAFVSVDG
ncbi:hypothetical protein ABOM_004512 [Aspergillus bombycis]|uniref:Uncharacterized protein n=1 Tax=Aspergillus bombycis TaxID=109264 RepID=A0A1F8A436_9EURO|nr:hypothetical protein ABOM_004512 [Aspergillus bombycis]OGM46502.1 hypothetical protein ABOM_004512 [Aspergillus bombycis]